MQLEAGKKYVEPAPVESPDDWVILDQTIYADHVPRVGIDQFQGWEDKWTDQDTFHSKQPIGEWHVATGGNQTRCRRKDLPPVPPVKPARPVIDPGKGYRLMEPHEVTLPDDERIYVWAADDRCGWDELALCNPREFVGVKVESLLPSRPDIAIRRKLPPKTRTVTLKEYACWNELHPNACVLVWQTDDARGDDCFDGYDNEHATGNERTIEIPL